ncbi:MAG: hypothetical protein ACE5R4_19170 [Armatimonadota bacterium]
MTRTAVELLRQAAQELRTGSARELVIPDYDDEEPYPLGIRPGTYRLAEAAEAAQFLADMLEE